MGRIPLLAAVVLAASLARAADAPRILHGLFTDHMVLQRDVKFPVWGFTDPGAVVRVRFHGEKRETRSGADGRWEVRFGPYPAGGPFTLKVKGPTKAKLENVMVGDVWICSGQSNMTQGIGVAMNPEAEIAAARHPGLRLYTVPNRIALTPERDVESRWLECTPGNVKAGGWGGFSAVGYFFGRDLHGRLGVPIGLIHTSWGGTRIQAWTSGDALARVPGFRDEVEHFRAAVEEAMKSDEPIDARVERWWTSHDPGTGGEWQSPGFDDSGWATMDVPSRFSAHPDLAEFDGAVWFRTRVRVPEAWAGRALTLSLGPVDDEDTTWFDGVHVGGKKKWDAPRSYEIPGRLVKAGERVIAVRVLDTGREGGLWGPRDSLVLSLDDDRRLALAGTWAYRRSVSLKDAPPIPAAIGENQHGPTVLFNGMLHPLLPFAVRGAIWYQGESNAWEAARYRKLLPAMIADWRAGFGDPRLPFLVVQLANFMEPHPDPREHAWAELREAQALTARADPRVGLAVAIDAGEADDIHPKNKQVVGARLALAARAIAYGEPVVHSGPVFKAMEVSGRNVRLDFDHVGGGLVARGGPLKGFAVAGRDGVFHWAQARIDGTAVVAASPRVRRPAAVRYGWDANPPCNLYNAEGLPAVPFRTDTPHPD